MPAGNWAEWVNVVVTMLALAAASIAVMKSSKMLKVEQERDRKRDEHEAEQREAAEQAMQADYVAAWPQAIAAKVINNSRYRCGK